MKKSKYLLFTLAWLLGTHLLSAHYLWVETNAQGKVGKSQEVKVFFGEYTYGLQEEVGGERFEPMKKFKVWVVAPDGQKTELGFEATDRYYISSFTPKTAGTYTVVLNNDEIDVIDYTQYDFGIFKTHYHSVAKVTVGSGDGASVAMNAEGLAVKDISGKKLAKGDELKLQVLYKGQPLTEQEVTVFISDQWAKKVWTDEDGKASLELPWGTKYIVEITKNEDVPGTYNGEDYQFVYHCVTYCIDLND